MPSATYDTVDAPSKRTARKASRKTAPGKSAAGRTAAGRTARGRTKRPRIDRAKVLRYVGIGLTGCVAIGIAVNALVLQKGHHPSPLFGHAVAIAAPTPSPAKPVRAVAPALPPPPVTPVPRPEPVTAPQPARNIEPQSSDDPIGHLLRTGAPPPETTHDKTVAGVQRALAKLGYAVKPTGTLGGSTRKAIQSFEKERHLVVDGDVSRRLVKVLSAESGLRID